LQFLHHKRRTCCICAVDDVSTPNLYRSYGRGNLSAIFLFSAGSIKQSFEVSEDAKTPYKLDVYCSFCTTKGVPAAFVLSMMCLRPICIDRTVEATFPHPKTWPPKNASQFALQICSFREIGGRRTFLGKSLIVFLISAFISAISGSWQSMQTVRSHPQ